MLADKFHCYKLILVIVVALVAVFHTALLHIDARISPDLLSSTAVREAPAELLCGRTGAIVRFENYTCDTYREEWTVDWTPSECQPSVDCDISARMSLCLNDGNCTQIAIGSTSRLEMDVLFEVLQTDNEGHSNFTARIVTAQTDQTRQPASLLCNCPIRCPALASPMSLLESNITDLPAEKLAEKEAERLKHNKGFWLYFVLRVIASGSLATSFSM